MQAIHRASQLATQGFEANYSDANITARQLQILAAIEANKGASQSQIVAITGVDRSTLAEVVSRLSGRKLIQRRRSKSDARAYILKLTEAGRGVLSDGLPHIASTERDLLAVLSTEDRETLLRLLKALVRAHETASRD